MNEKENLKDNDLKEKKGGLPLDIAKTILTVGLTFLFVRYFVVQPFLVVGSSMEPNFHDSEYIFVNELSYHLTAPHRGDVVVFKHPEPECTDFVNASFINRIFLQGPCKNYIKRVIGLPGETIKIENGKVTIINTKHPAGFDLDEGDYISSDIKLYGNQSVTLGKNEYYVIGDNRLPNGSSDSREWGPLPRQFITGKAALIVLPTSSAGLVPNPKY
ncbi:signal peptidase I [bacterium (Candidatus Howlettbacteria) CG_4_10_14_0_8_um_filter_40_9]|nr:MAG: signal peptidase I [bacterium (Candidatus Howlettbacteria) CG_4_10_14_0_8_um_filter_40_9]